MIPSNSLAAVYGIAADCAERQVLGPDIGIDIEAIDETNTRVDVPALVAQRNLTPEDIGKMASKARVKTVVLTHLGATVIPNDDYKRQVDEVKKHFTGNVVVAKDLMEL
jgi:phosphoribosyl 1,2-cyclic phosphodiesterase